MNPVTLNGIFEPDTWFVVFHRGTWLRFNHVSAIAYCAGFKLWIIYDTEMNGTRLRVLPHSKGTVTRLTYYMRGCAVIRIQRNFSPKHFALTSRLGFYCVPAIKHLLGVHCASLWPSGLYRALLRNGGVLINENAEPAAAADGSVTDHGTATSPKFSHI